MSISNDYIEATLRQYYDLKSENKLVEAREVLVAAAERNSFAAKLELARFLCRIPDLRMPQNERYVKAEALYKDCICQLDLPCKVTAHIAHEMADLYSKQNRPLACLGALLMVKRHGLEIPDDELAECKDKLHRIDINNPGTPQDAFLLGQELYLAGMAGSMAEYFLRVASDSSDDLIRGMAFLLLADHYDRMEDSLFYKEQAIRCYRLAKENGYPDYIAPHKNRTT